MPKITIRNLGPISSIENLEIKDVMVLIGPQASGKSTVAKAVYFFESLPNEVLRFFIEHSFEVESTADTIQVLKKHLLDIFSLHGHAIKPNTYIHFDFGNGIEVTLASGNGQKALLELVFSSNLQEAFNEINSAHNAANKSEKSEFTDVTGQIGVVKNIIIGATSKILLQHFDAIGPIVYVPAGRSVYAFLSDNVFKIANTSPQTGEFFIYRFFEFLENVRKFLGSNDIRWVVEELSVKYGFDIVKIPPQSVLEKIDAILKGSYRRENGEDRIYLPGSETNYVPLRNASSGQQESLWILMSLYYGISELLVHNFILEEPEAHLFPDAQKELVELMAMFANATTFNRLLITTHSPYILTSLNNLLYAYQVGQNDEKGVSEIVERESWLDPKRVAAYFVDNGTLESIMDENLIQAERIDVISNQIFTNFDKLFEFEK
ncbi:MAG: AAA family ATPase [Saprospiraceae bacterium]|nr:AAA family ATPase [Saprospiraceae bacterium]